MRQPPLLDSFAAWLTAFGDAWEAADASSMAANFGPSASLQPTPFADLLRGRGAIGDHWQAELSGAREIHFHAQVLGAGDTYGIAHWRVAYASGGQQRVRDGIMLAALDARGRCTSLRLWWHEDQSAG
jgi:hypothetical protein